ncbi:MAG: tyrosine-type recombinase/integrase [Candidatus Binatia bacterium]
MAKKRGQRDGSIFQRADKRWCAIVSLGWRNGKRHRKHFYGRTRRDVQGQLTAALRAHQQGLPVDPERQTVAEFLHRWLDDCCTPRLRLKTLRSYRDTVRLHLNPQLGRIPLAKLAPQHVQACLKHLAAAPAASRRGAGRSAPAGLSSVSVAYARTVLRAALNRALRWGLVARNVAALVDPPRIARKEVAPFTLDEARQFIDAIRGDRLEALYTVALALGLREGEALGLRWDDIDLDGATLNVRQQLQRVTGKGLQLVELKTERSRRTLALPRAVARALRAHRVQQMEERLLAGSRWVDSGQVFTTRRGTPLDAANALKAFKRALHKAGLRDQRFHDLRHGAATLLLAQGVQPRAIMDLLGHSQVGVTLNLYSHILPEVRRDTARQMDALLSAGE